MALSVDRTAGHHFDGMLSRLNHLITAQFPAPTSAAMASLEGQSSMTDRNDVSGESGMPELLGQCVPNYKAIMGRDLKTPVGHSVPMSEAPEKIAESAWQKAWLERLHRIQGKRTHENMAKFLEMGVEQWKKCVNRGDVFPIRKLPRLALLAGIPVESLIEGDRDDELPEQVVRYKKRAPATAKRRSG